MTSTYHSSFSPFPIDLNQDAQLLFSPSSKDASSSSSTSFSYPIFDPSYNYPDKQAENIYTSRYGESWDHPTIKIENGNTEDQRDNSSSVKWMSSKMRLMRKMMTSDQTNSIHKFQQQKETLSPSEDDNNTKKPLSNKNNSIRVCADCNTTTTPLWRSGPRGPKSLCNACGIRQRKARRAALAAAQASENGTIFASESAAMKVQNKEKKISNNSHLPFKKRCKFTAQARGRKKLCFEDLSSIILSKTSAFQQVFPQDEKEAAILLMALSYGLVHG